MSRGGEHYMPRPDANFSAWANHYFNAVTVFYEEHGLDQVPLITLGDAITAWNAAYPDHIAAQAAAESARQAKDAARVALEKAVRPITNFVQSYPQTTNADRAAMGITVRDTSPTPAPAPTSRPLTLVESGQRLTHHLRLVDESTPTRKRRPAGVLGAEVWVKLVETGTPRSAAGTGQQALGTGEGTGSGVSSSQVPSAQSQVPGFSFLTMTTRPSFRAEFKVNDGGKTAVYMARWVNTRGEKGPWSEIATATVAA